MNFFLYLQGASNQEFKWTFSYPRQAQSSPGEDSSPPELSGSFPDAFMNQNLQKNKQALI